MSCGYPEPRLDRDPRQSINPGRKNMDVRSLHIYRLIRETIAESQRGQRITCQAHAANDAEPVPPPRESHTGTSEEPDDRPPFAA